MSCKSKAITNLSAGVVQNQLFEEPSKTIDSLAANINVCDSLELLKLTKTLDEQTRKLATQAIKKNKSIMHNLFFFLKTNPEINGISKSDIVSSYFPLIDDDYSLALEMLDFCLNNPKIEKDFQESILLCIPKFEKLTKEQKRSLMDSINRKISVPLSVKKKLQEQNIKGEPKASGLKKVHIYDFVSENGTTQLVGLDDYFDIVSEKKLSDVCDYKILRTKGRFYISGQNRHYASSRYWIVETVKHENGKTTAVVIEERNGGKEWKKVLAELQEEVNAKEDTIDVEFHKSFLLRMEKQENEYKKYNTNKYGYEELSRQFDLLIENEE